jgi:hypothetical protein
VPTAEAIEDEITLLLKDIVFLPFRVVDPYVGPLVIVTVRPLPDLSVHPVIGAVPVTVLESAASNQRAIPATLKGLKADENGTKVNGIRVVVPLSNCAEGIHEIGMFGIIPIVCIVY